MKILRNVVKRIIRWANNSDNKQEQESVSLYSNSVTRMSIKDFNNGINFTVFSAIGGKVIQLSSYDPVKDQHKSKLYIVTDEEDLGEEIAQIITIECLTR